MKKEKKKKPIIIKWLKVLKAGVLDVFNKIQKCLPCLQRLQHYGHVLISVLKHECKKLLQQNSNKYLNSFTIHDRHFRNKKKTKKIDISNIVSKTKISNRFYIKLNQI